MKILVVDDSATVRLFYRSVLEPGGYEIDEARDGQQALVMALSDSYQLYIVDINMLYMDGLCLLRMLRARDDIAQAPVIVISTQSSKEDEMLAKQAGANLYLSKPVARNALAYYAGVMASGQQRGGK